MTADALFLNSNLWGLTGFRYRVNFLMTIRAGHVLFQGVHIRLIRRRDLAMTVCATDRIRFLFAQAVPGNVVNSRMAAGAGIVAVSGCRKTIHKSGI
jgi:hypothetical protein